MKQYIVDVLIGLQSVKKYVVDNIEIAQMIAENIKDDVTDVVIREAKLNNQ